KADNVQAARIANWRGVCLTRGRSALGERAESKAYRLALAMGEVVQRIGGLFSVYRPFSGARPSFSGMIGKVCRAGSERTTSAGDGTPPAVIRCGIVNDPAFSSGKLERWTPSPTLPKRPLRSLSCPGRSKTTIGLASARLTTSRL